ncbi:DUF418 domain-containing protein [Marinactinospora rubrisoli]|uniref:DUF418 domain-containing protein n=1 Tax=Marinactinospora rubrisoli TaxID=2715399 RepID=A0ABW2KAI1_9ACTN
MTDTVRRRPGTLDPEPPAALGPEAETLLGAAVAGLVLAASPLLVAPGGVSPPGFGDMGPLLFGAAAEQRVLPLLAFLAGAVGTLLADHRVRRGERAVAVWLGSLRPLAVLAVLGALHGLLHPGDVLFPLVVIAVVVLFPVAWLPGWIVLLAGVLGTVLGVTVMGGHWVIPGMLLLGMAAVRHPPAAWPPRDARDLWAVLLIGSGGATGMLLGYGVHPGGPYQTQIQSLTGLLTAAAGAAAVLLVLRLPLVGAALAWVLRPLGRMPVTCYLTATPAVALLGRSVVPPDAGPHPVVTVAVTVLVAQLCWGRWWLARHEEGPVEGYCRRLTDRRTVRTGAVRPRTAGAADGGDWSLRPAVHPTARSRKTRCL